MFKRLLTFLAPLLFFPVAVFALSVFQPIQGGTGVGTFNAGNNGLCLSQISANPPTYGFATCAGGGGSGTSTQTGWSTSGTNVYLTTSTNFVGIGTNFPSSSLHVIGTSTVQTLNLTGLVLDSTGSSGAPGYFLSSNGTSTFWNPMNFGGELNYFFSGVSSSIAGNKLALSSPTSTQAVYTFAGLSSGTTTLLSFITATNSPFLTSFPNGFVSTDLYGSKTAGTMTAQLYSIVSEVNSNGTLVKIIGQTSLTNPLISGTTEQDVDFNVTSSYFFASTTSRLKISIVASVSGGGSNPTVAVSIGNGTDSHLSLPSPTIDASNFVPYTGASQNLNLGTYSITASATSSFAGATFSRNVGIGTTAPFDLLDVSSSTTAGIGGRIVITNPASAAVGNEVDLGFKVSNNFVANYYSSRIASILSNAATRDTDLAFFNYNTASGAAPGGREAMRITSAGNVGIGTTNPSSTLSLGNGVAAQKLLLYDNNDFSKYGFGIQAGQFRQFYPSNAVFSLGTISTGDGTTFSEKMRMDSSGNVGIGTTTPSQKLHVSSAGNDILSDSTSGDVTISTALDGARKYSIYGQRSGNNLGIYDWTAGLFRMLIAGTTGNIGFGANSAAQQGMVLGQTRNFATEMVTPAAPTFVVNSSTGSLASSTYFFKIVASDAVGTSIAGAEASTSTASLSSSTITVSWTAVTGALYYRVYFATSTGAQASYFQTPFSTSVVTTYAFSTTTGATVAALPTAITSYANKISSAGDSWLNGGKVGVGIAAPLARLHVSDYLSTAITADSELLSLQTSYTGNSAQKSLTWRDQTQVVGQIDTRFDGTSVNMVFGHLYNSVSSTADAMIIKGTGRVGINTSTPSATFAVKGIAGVSDSFLVTSSSGATYLRVDRLGRVYLSPSSTGLVFYGAGGDLASSLTATTIEDTGNFFVNANSDAAGGGDVQLGTAGSVFMTIKDTSGNVGIGTTTPAYKLSVTGTVQFKNLTTSAGLQTAVMCLDANAQVISDSVACLASARRFKTDIKPLKVGLDELMKLEPISFKWTKEFNKGFEDDANKNGVQYSLVADDVQKVDKHLVVVETAGKDKGLVAGLADLNHYVAFFVQSIKDLMNRYITPMLFRLNTLEADNQKLQKQIDTQAKSLKVMQQEIKQLQSKVSR